MTSIDLRRFIQTQNVNKQGRISIKDDISFSQNVRIEHLTNPVIFEGKICSEFEISFGNNCDVTFRNVEVKTMNYSPSNNLTLHKSKIDSFTNSNNNSSLSIVGEVNIENCLIKEVDLNNFNHRISIINSKIDSFRLQGNSNLDLEILGKNGKKSYVEKINIFGNYSKYQGNNKNLKISNSIIGKSENREISEFNTELVELNFSNVEFLNPVFFLGKKNKINCDNDVKFDKVLFNEFNEFLNLEGFKSKRLNFEGDFKAITLYSIACSTLDTVGIANCEVLNIEDSDLNNLIIHNSNIKQLNIVGNKNVLNKLNFNSVIN